MASDWIYMGSGKDQKWALVTKPQATGCGTEVKACKAQLKTVSWWGIDVERESIKQFIISLIVIKLVSPSD